MKKPTNLLILIIVMAFGACGYVDLAFRPKNMTILFSGKDVGADAVMLINGYYANDSTSSIIFYNDGSTCLLRNRVAPARSRGQVYFDEPYYIKKLLWGTYRIKDGIVEAQYIDKPWDSTRKVVHYTMKIIDKQHLSISNACSFNSWMNTMWSFTDTRAETLNEENHIIRFYPYPNDFRHSNWLFKHKWIWK